MRERRTISEAMVAASNPTKRRNRTTAPKDDSHRHKEGKLSKDTAKSLPNATYYPTMDTYGHMRAMVLAASLPEEPSIPSSSVVRDHPFSIGYSSADQDIINKAAKLCGYPVRPMSDKYSKEPDHVHRTSPINHNSGKHPK